MVPGTIFEMGARHGFRKWCLAPFFALNFRSRRFSLRSMKVLANDRRGIAVRWAADTPRVRRLWLLDDGRYGVDIEPVADSEETLALWIAHAEGWRAQLAERLGSPCAIEWI